VASSRSIWSLIAVETLCLLGEEVSRFGISVWIYAATQSVGDFSALLVANIVPGMLVRPIAGSVVDRWSRKPVMIGASLVSLVGTAIVLFGALVGALSMPLVLAGASIASIADSFQWPALEATIPLMADEEDLPAYNGFMESGRAIGRFAGPAIGGFLFAMLGVSGLVAIEAVTFLLATVVVASLSIPNPVRQDEPEAGSLVADALLGFRWIGARRPLLKFLLVATFANFFLAISEVVMQPYGLSFLSERSYGIGNALFGAGMIAGGVLCGVVAERLSSIQQVFMSSIAIGVAFVALGFTRGLAGYASLNFVIAAMMTMVNASAMTIWQLKVPDELQGRVFSAMGLVADLVTPLSFVLAAPLTEALMPAVFRRTGAAAIWGSSETGEMGALFSAMGVLLVVGFVFAWTRRDIRSVQEAPA
jgi:MFS family permease